MLAKVLSFGILGIDAYPVDIEVDVANGLPSVSIVGLPDSAIKESKERVRAGIKNSGFDYPVNKITVNMAPADIKKEGSAFDLPIALGILAASEQINIETLKSYYFIGELSLNGELRPVKGALAMALALKKKKVKNIVLPETNANEAAIVKEAKVFGIKTLREAIDFLHAPETLQPYKTIEYTSRVLLNTDLDFSDVKGQMSAKRALEIAAAGRHNILFIGPPGSGKTMLAKRLITILPDLSEEESLETTKIHSSAGLIDPESGLMKEIPFRAPHHTISDTALVGGGTLPQPGEISLAHNGILFMDELPEFHKDVLEALRQPLEEGRIRVSRVARSLSFPARFMLVCAMNPCRCGGLGQAKNLCRCMPYQVQRYRSKISGPLLDRIDIHVEVPAVKYQEITSEEPTESSAEVKKRVKECRRVQKQRFCAVGAKNENVLFNSAMNHKQIKKHCSIGREASELLKNAIEKFHLSMRAYDKVLKVSRTIADLDLSDDIQTAHVAEAIQYRNLDRQFI